MNEKNDVLASSIRQATVLPNMHVFSIFNSLHPNQKTERCHSNENYRRILDLFIMLLN